MAWASLLATRPDDELYERYLASFRYYRNWHLEAANRNPAFIPWHTQAHYMVWQQRRDPALARFIFLTNDWLLREMHSPGAASSPDMAGRFYKPGGAYGPPHASSTGVYLEGLIDAFCLARELGDTQREAAYRLAIRRGLRSVLQLTFGFGQPLWYIRQPQRAFGGVRETVYHNEIRVDNVQHNLMAIMKILRHFSREDFTHEDDEAPANQAPSSSPKPLGQPRQ
ncbi:MAG: hypothetical protein EA402_12190 [Planctomycetota bacterium]|nr:MAG: hypothetical protein EA402_12190 [Planctomycetota bacterium]